MTVMMGQLSLEIILSIAVALVIASFAMAMLSDAHALAYSAQEEIGSYVNMSAQYAQRMYAQAMRG